MIKNVNKLNFFAAVCKEKNPDVGCRLNFIFFFIFFLSKNKKGCGVSVDVLTRIFLQYSEGSG